jgi:hypothetical protein
VAEGEFKKVPLDPRVPDKTVCIGAKASHQEQSELLSFLDKNSDVFGWSTSDLVGVSRDVIEHRLQVSPTAKLKKAKAPQNGRRESGISEGRGAKVT